MNKKKLKRYTIGFGNDGDWIDNTLRVNNIQDSDIIIIPGGIDVSPTFYNEPRGKHTQVYDPSHRDKTESKALHYAFNEGKYSVGICRGSQLQTVLAGGRLIQHVNNHHEHHDMKTINGNTLVINSIHHQMCYPWDLPQDEYIVLGWSESVSNTYLNGWDQEIEFPDIAKTTEGNIIEPEIIWYPKKRFLGAQWHPELMWYRDIHENASLMYLNEILQTVISEPYYYHETYKELIK